MQQIPEIGFLKLRHILGDAHATPPIVPIIPVKKSCWWAGVKIGRFPAPVKIGTRGAFWRVEDIRDLVSSVASITDNIDGESRTPLPVAARTEMATLDFVFQLFAVDLQDFPAVSVVDMG